jgi:hypothetical protein
LNVWACVAVGATMVAAMLKKPTMSTRSVMAASL